MTRVLVCGGREYDDGDALNATLCALHHGERGPFAALIHGAARGADSLAGAWARANGVTECAFLADWETLGRAVGPIRNKRMLDEGKLDLVTAFPGGRGTANMVLQAGEAGVEVIAMRQAKFHLMSPIDLKHFKDYTKMCNAGKSLKG